MGPFCGQTWPRAIARDVSARRTRPSTCDSTSCACAPSTVATAAQSWRRVSEMASRRVKWATGRRTSTSPGPQRVARRPRDMLPVPAHLGTVFRHHTDLWNRDRVCRIWRVIRIAITLFRIPLSVCRVLKRHADARGWTARLDTAKLDLIAILVNLCLAPAEGRKSAVTIHRRNGMASM